MAVIVTSDPHLVGAHIREQDVIGPEDLTGVPDRLLRPDQTLGVVVRVACQFLAHALAHVTLSAQVKVRLGLFVPDAR